MLTLCFANVRPNIGRLAMCAASSEWLTCVLLASRLITIEMPMLLPMLRMR